MSPTFMIHVNADMQHVNTLSVKVKGITFEPNVCLSLFKKCTCSFTALPKEIPIKCWEQECASSPQACQLSRFPYISDPSPELLVFSPGNLP